ncbi:MAG: hypothetical protein IK078_10395, partial [Lachnospiraceae bacterium]|nr:hypothetical protein [Lachnospiraceae bacterium]
MPKTKYENINSEQELKKKYEKSLKDVDKRQRADWDNGFKETSEYAEKKKAAMLDFLGADLSDQDFEAFENKLQEEGPAKNLFNRMTNELTAIQIIQHKELFQKALAGDILKLTQKEQEESFEAASQTCRQYDQEKKRRSEKINAAVNEKEARDKR